MGVTRACARHLPALAHPARALGRRTLERGLLLVLATLISGAMTAGPAHTSLTASAVVPEALTPEALAQARVIRAEVDARYRQLPGRKLAVTEATTTGVVRTVTLVSDWLEHRVVPTSNGIYFALCSPGARCPYPLRAAAWPTLAFLPRREALELALRTFLETSVSLVVVGLPTAKPVWVVFERDDLLAEMEAPAVLAQLAPSPAVVYPALRALVGRLTRPRLYAPLPILPPPDDTIYAVRL